MGGACSTPTEDEHELSIRLQHGPDADEVHTIIKPAHSSCLVVNSQTRLSPSFPLTPAPPKRVPISDDQSRPARLISELRLMLAKLPTEWPQGSEDIYGENTSIAWQSDDFRWWNGGPEGCGGGGKSKVQPTEKDKEKFRRAVDIVYELVDWPVESQKV
ncbi:hypothetical protein H0H92_001655 [Tricholoma furcatifolium]|nr:hypothetical protein H0H92_001655 [Tricholoma furcatifolium]